MTSHPPARCCTVGVTHEGEAKGEMKMIGDTSTYFSFPEAKQPTTAILILTDVIGHNFINPQLIADQFAANGYLVAMPDLFHGDPIPLNRPADFDLQKWLRGPPGPGHLPPRVDPVVAAVIAELRSTYAITRLGAVGYCFGGKYVARFMAAGKGVDVGYTAHPSFVDVEELRGVTGPLSIAAAETDAIFPAEKRRETEDVLKEMQVPYQLCLYSGVEHGFAVRGDVKKREARFAKEAAFEQAVVWFNEYLKE